MEPDNDHLSLSGADRFDRLERMIEKVLDRLETKVDAPAMDKLEVRVRDLEQHGSRQAIEAISTIEKLREQLAKLQGRVQWATGAMAAIVLIMNVGLHFVGV